MWDNARALNAATAIIAIATLVALAWALTSWAVRQPAFAFREVVIEGPLSRANPAFLEAVIREEIRGTFFTMRLADARASRQELVAAEAARRPTRSRRRPGVRPRARAAR